MDPLPSTCHAVRRRIECQIRHLEFGELLNGAPTGDRSQSGEQDFEVERSGQIVVRADVEPFDDVGGRVTGGEHEERRPAVCLPQTPGDLESVQTRQHDIEDNHVEPVRPAQV